VAGKQEEQYMSEVQTRRAADPEDLENLAPIVGWAFGGGTSRALEWLRGGGAAHVRVASRGGKLCGGLLEIPMGQWFGGQSVPTLGLAGVAIAPEARGQKLALSLVRDTLRAARQQGVALSTLYPSSYGLYRKLGYELAGSHCRFTLQLRQLQRRARSAPVESLGEDWQPAMETTYREVARHQNGYLDRGAYVWNRVRRPDQEPARAFGVQGPEGLEGYLYVRLGAARRAPLELSISDFVARTPRAMTAFLAFLTAHVTTAERATWSGGSADARLFALSENALQCNIEDYWMLRLVDVRAALLARGYPGLDAAVELHVQDDLLPENAGRYPLSVRGGQASLDERITAPVARLSVGALAALYSGFASPWQLAVAGQLEADEAARVALARAFAGPAPGLGDYF
jgi:predicted acetyltransferase